jgi:hypothetical protein
MYLLFFLMAYNVGAYAVRKLKDRKSKHPQKAKSQILVRNFLQVGVKSATFRFKSRSGSPFFSPELAWI